MKKMTQLELKETLRDWQAVRKRMRALRERLVSLRYPITQNYDCAGGGACGGSSSKVERFCIRRDDVESELHELEERCEAVVEAVKTADLTQMERSLIGSIISGCSISCFARQNEMYISSAYKLRDRAIAKIHNSMS